MEEIWFFLSFFLIISFVFTFIVFYYFFYKASKEKIWIYETKNLEHQKNIEKYIIDNTKLEQDRIHIIKQIDMYKELEITLIKKNEEISNLKHFNSELLAKIKYLEEKNLDERSLNLERESYLKQIFSEISMDSLNKNINIFKELTSTSLSKLEANSKQDSLEKERVFQSIITPFQQTIDKMEQNINMMEKTRLSAYESIAQQIKDLIDGNNKLRQETINLSKALRSPNVRGRWGEFQLKRVVELAGMIEHSDFIEQVCLDNDGGILKPDMIVYLPGNKCVVVDSKVPLTSYMDAIETDNDLDKTLKFKEHARHVKNHINALSKKNYWDQFSNTPEFVVLFLPSEALFSVALEYDPSLIELGVDQKIILATPTTLISLLRAVSYGWRQEALHKNAENINSLGKELYKRLQDVSKHLQGLGKSLNKSVDDYNKFIGSFETRVLVSARKLNELGIGSESSDIPKIQNILHIAKT